MTSGPRWWLWALGAAIGVFLIAPSLVVVVMSFSSGKLMTFPPPGFGVSWYGHFFESEPWTRSALNSVEIAIVSAVLATILGTLTAFGLVRGRPRGAGLINAIIISPLIVPLIVTAIGMYFAYQKLGLDAYPGLVMAHTVLGLPFVVVTVVASLYGVDQDLELAARNLGATPVRSFFRVTLPLILPGVLVGAIFAFVTSWDEVVIALFLTTPTLRTLPVTMWEQTRHSVDPTMAAASSLLTAFTLFVLLAVITIRRLSALSAKGGTR
jgi:putative spermidine/putrescine transport system permease protein